jgi:hypothetical protein
MQVFDYGREMLKWIAIITMAIDHIGAVLYPEYEVLRWIGRLAFPLFAYILVLGMESTRNISKYFVRLFAFALISQVPFFLAIDKGPFDMLNVFFTLAFGLMFIYYIKRGSVIAFIPLVISFVVPFDYGVYGLAVIGCMYIITVKKKLGVVALVLLNTLFLFPFNIQILSLAAVPLVLLHQNGSLDISRETIKEYGIPLWRKYFFYAFYPVHLALLYIIKLLFF